jgi:hypothetical protein
LRYTPTRYTLMRYTPSKIYAYRYTPIRYTPSKVHGETCIVGLQTCKIML